MKKTNLKIPRGIWSVYYVALVDKIHAVAWGHIQYSMDFGVYYSRGEIDNSQGLNTLIIKDCYLPK